MMYAFDKENVPENLLASRGNQACSTQLPQARHSNLSRIHDAFVAHQALKPLSIDFVPSFTAPQDHLRTDHSISDSQGYQYHTSSNSFNYQPTSFPSRSVDSKVGGLGASYSLKRGGLGVNGQSKLSPSTIETTSTIAALAKPSTLSSIMRSGVMRDDNTAVFSAERYQTNPYEFLGGKEFIILSRDNLSTFIEAIQHKKHESEEVTAAPLNDLPRLGDRAIEYQKYTNIFTDESKIEGGGDSQHISLKGIDDSLLMSTQYTSRGTQKSHQRTTPNTNLFIRQPLRDLIKPSSHSRCRRLEEHSEDVSGGDFEQKFVSVQPHPLPLQTAAGAAISRFSLSPKPYKEEDIPASDAKTTIKVFHSIPINRIQSDGQSTTSRMETATLATCETQREGVVSLQSARSGQFSSRPPRNPSQRIFQQQQHQQSHQQQYQQQQHKQHQLQQQLYQQQSNHQHHHQQQQYQQQQQQSMEKMARESNGAINEKVQIVLAQKPIIKVLSPRIFSEVFSSTRSVRSQSLRGNQTNRSSFEDQQPQKGNQDLNLQISRNRQQLFEVNPPRSNRSRSQGSESTYNLQPQQQKASPATIPSDGCNIF